jgi:hypothetical protein
MEGSSGVEQRTDLGTMASQMRTLPRPTMVACTPPPLGLSVFLCFCVSVSFVRLCVCVSVFVCLSYELAQIRP